MRRMKASMGIAVCLVMMLVVTACQKDKAETFEGMGFHCADVQYSSTSGKPMDEINLRHIPSNFGEVLSMVVSDNEGENSLLVPVELDPDGGGASFQLPLHPGFSSKGGEVNVTLIDESDQYCDAVPLMIEALPDAPGAYKAFVDLLVELGNVQARVFGIDHSERSREQLMKENPFARPHVVIDDLVQGAENLNSIRRIADNESPIVGELSEEQWELIDGLIKQSGILPALEKSIAHLDTLESLSMEQAQAALPSKTSNLVMISSLVEVPLTCLTPWHKPDAALLDKLMNRQIKNEIYGDGTELLDASALLWNITGVLASAAGVPQITKVTDVIGHGINIAKVRYEAFEGILPSEFIDMRVDVLPVQFLEDDEQLDGKWESARVTAKSRGWSPDKALFEFLLNQLGGRISSGAQKRFNLELQDGTKALGDFANGVWDSHLTNELYGNETSRTGLIEVPPCEFGPTDISDENWSSVRVIPEGTAPIHLVDHHTFRAHDTGEAELEISPRGDRFGRRSFQADGTFLSRNTAIKIEQIEVNVSPVEQSVEPGSSAQFKASVKNANDPSIIWEVRPAGRHQISIETDQDGESLITLHTSKYEEDFPVNLRAISASSTGLRALIDAPDRDAYGLLRSTSRRIEITPDECCVEPGEQQAFQATIHNLADQRVSWSASAGTIDENGLFTAPDQPALVTIIATSIAQPSLTKKALVRVGDCDCMAEWEIGAFGVKQSSNVSQMERAGEDGEGRLTKLLFSNLLNGENMQIIFEGEGPLPGERGTYPVQIINAANEMSAQSIIFRNGVVVGVPSPHHPDGFYVALPPGLQDGNARTFHDELHATVTIDEFRQIGSEPHHVRIRGRIEGRVEAVEYDDNVSLETNMTSVHLMGSINGSFQGDYTVRHKNPSINPFAGSRSSVYWDVCGMEASEIPFAESIDIRELIHTEEYINQMDPNDRSEIEDMLNWDELDGLDELSGVEGMEQLKDILNMFGN